MNVDYTFRKFLNSDFIDIELQCHLENLEKKNQSWTVSGLAQYLSINIRELRGASLVELTPYVHAFLEKLPSSLEYSV